jgi:hypothetical protein
MDSVTFAPVLHLSPETTDREGDWERCVFGRIDLGSFSSTEPVDRGLEAVPLVISRAKWFLHVCGVAYSRDIS